MQIEIQVHFMLLHTHFYFLNKAKLQKCVWNRDDNCNELKILEIKFSCTPECVDV